MRLLLLAGSEQARQLVFLLISSHQVPRHQVIYSLAGLRENDTIFPQTPYLTMRRGGFGGQAGLERYLEEERIEALIDATHPFAIKMATHAVLACKNTGIKHIKYGRKSWQSKVGDDWINVNDFEEAAQILPQLGRRVYCALGQFGTEKIRIMQPNVCLYHKAYEPLTDFLQENKIDLILCRESGAKASFAKLEVARVLGLKMLMIKRPDFNLCKIVTELDQVIIELERL